MGWTREYLYRISYTKETGKGHRKSLAWNGKENYPPGGGYCGKDKKRGWNEGRQF